jgi:hypothetical protein
MLPRRQYDFATLPHRLATVNHCVITVPIGKQIMPQQKTPHKWRDFEIQGPKMSRASPQGLLKIDNDGPSSLPAWVIFPAATVQVVVERLTTLVAYQLPRLQIDRFDAKYFPQRFRKLSQFLHNTRAKVCRHKCRTITACGCGGCLYHRSMTRLNRAW